jgi:hypothetical protein
MSYARYAAETLDRVEQTRGSIQASAGSGFGRFRAQAVGQWDATCSGTVSTERIRSDHAWTRFAIPVPIKSHGACRIP